MIIDVYCAANSKGTRCGQVPNSYFDEHILYACQETIVSRNFRNCPVSCTTALRLGLTEFGCCLTSLLQLILREKYATALFRVCGVVPIEDCIRPFSENLLLPSKEEQCRRRKRKLPVECRQYISKDFLLYKALYNTANFKSIICDGISCSQSLYNYFIECDKIMGWKNASFLDFLCSENDKGIPCAGI